jgi:phospholipid transport system substrate-binding protein
MKRGLVILLAWLAAASFPIGVWAVPSAKEVVETTANAVLERMRRDEAELRADPTRVYALVDELILPHFDFVRMGRWVLGKYWRDANDEQRRRFVSEFRTLLVRTYSTALLKYTDQPLNIVSEQVSESGKVATVESEFELDGGTLSVDYKMHIRDGTWKVFDVNIDGISLITTYRASFNSEIRKAGLDRFMTNLITRNEEALRGT